MREFFVTNARYWIEEFHLDGLRLDATQQIFDSSPPPHHRGRFATRSRAASAGRGTIVVGENEPQDTSPRPVARRGRLRARRALERRLPSRRVGRGHRSRRSVLQRLSRRRAGVRLGGEVRISVSGTVVPLAETTTRHAGARLSSRRSSSPSRRITIRSRTPPRGRRMHQETSPGRYRALTALLLLLPQTPMLFQGQEFGASAPFLYFADHCGAARGSCARRAHDVRLAVPELCRARTRRARRGSRPIPWTFLRCKLDWAERTTNARSLALHRDLIRLRRDDPVLRRQQPRSARRRGAQRPRVRASLLRRRAGRPSARREPRRAVARRSDRRAAARSAARAARGEPSSRPNRREYDGWGAPPLEVHDDGWWIPAESAALLSPTDDPTPPR